MAMLMFRQRGLSDFQIGGAFFTVKLVIFQKLALKNWHGHSEENRVTKQTERPYPKANECFIQAWRVFDHFTEGRRDETRNHQAHALLYPNPNDAKNAGQVEPLQTAAQRQHEQDHRN